MTDYYIDYTNGSDSNTGTSELSPWKTFTGINALAATLTAGDRVLLKRGSTWPSPNQLILNGANTGNLTVPYIVRPYGSGPAPHIDHGGSTFGYPLSGTGGAVWIDGIEVSHTSGADGYGLYWEIPDMGSQPFQAFSNLSIHHCGNDGVFVVGSSKTGTDHLRVISGCLVHTCGNDGISLGLGWKNYYVIGNKIHSIAQINVGTIYGFLDTINGSSGDGITAHDSNTFITVRGNEIYSCVDGINLVNYGTVGTTLIERNWIYGCEEKLIWVVNSPGLGLTAATPWVIRNNVLCLSSAMANNSASKGLTPYVSTLGGLVIGWPDSEFGLTETEVVFNAAAYNNTFYNNHATAVSAFAYAKSAGTNYSTLNVRNNAFRHPGAAPYITILGRDKIGASGANLTCNYNGYDTDRSAGWKLGAAGSATNYNSLTTASPWDEAPGTPDVNGALGVTLVGDASTNIDNSRLAAGSGAIGIGTNLAGTFTDDWEGRLRPSAGAWDAGAHHRWVGTSTPTIAGARMLSGMGR